MGDSSSHYLPAIYDAALGDEHWPRALDLLSREIGSVGAILISVDLVGLPFHIQQACSRYGVGRVRHYFDTFGHYDEPALGPTLALMPPLKLLRDCDVWGDITLLQDRPDYKWLREEIGACRKSAVRLSRNNGSLDLLALQFDRPWAEVPDGLQGRLDLLLPHVAKVVEINRKFTLLRQRYQAALAALDHVRIGTCLTAPTGQVIVANAEALRIFALDDGIGVSKAGFLTCSAQAATASLTSKILAMTATAGGENAGHEVLMFVERRSGGRPFLIEIAPLRDSIGEVELGSRAPSSSS